METSRGEAAAPTRISHRGDVAAPTRIVGDADKTYHGGAAGLSEFIGDGNCDYGDPEQPELSRCDFTCEADEAPDCASEFFGGPVQDCTIEDQFWPAIWVTDDFCDGPGRTLYADLSCYPDEKCRAALPDGSCPVGYAADCTGDGDCVPVSWIGDEVCDAGPELKGGGDLSCYCDEAASAACTP